MNLPTEDMEDLHWSSLLQDVGKIAVDQSIQNKPRKLTIASLNLAVIELFNGTPDTPLAVTAETTIGAVVCDKPVVKLQTKFCASELPPRHFTAVVIMAMYAVFGESIFVGVNIAVS